MKRNGVNALSVIMQFSSHQIRYFAHELTRRHSSDSVEKLASVLAGGLEVVRAVRDGKELTTKTTKYTNK